MINIFKKLVKYLNRYLTKSQRTALILFDRIVFNNNSNLSDNLYNNDSNAFFVIFSKDRAIQLHALIESYLRKVNNLKEMYILYTCSSFEFEKSYNELITLYKLNTKIIFVRETNFRKDLINLIKKEKNSKIIFGCDDCIFSKELDLNDFCKINPKKAVGSLLRGLDHTFCFSYNMEQSMPNFYHVSNDIFFNDKIIWKWKEASDSPDWAYPLALGFHMFDKKEIIFILNNTKFKAPNSLEGGMQFWLPNFITRLGISYKETAISSTPINLVNNEVINNTSNGCTSEELLFFWNNGYRINYEEFDGLNATEAPLHKINFILR